VRFDAAEHRDAVAQAEALHVRERLVEFPRQAAAEKKLRRFGQAGEGVDQAGASALSGRNRS